MWTGGGDAKLQQCDDGTTLDLTLSEEEMAVAWQIGREAEPRPTLGRR